MPWISLIYPPTQDASGKWTFLGGAPLPKIWNHSGGDKPASWVGGVDPMNIPPWSPWPYPIRKDLQSQNPTPYIEIPPRPSSRRAVTSRWPQTVETQNIRTFCALDLLTKKLVLGQKKTSNNMCNKKVCFFFMVIYHGRLRKRITKLNKQKFQSCGLEQLQYTTTQPQMPPKTQMSLLPSAPLRSLKQLHSKHQLVTEWKITLL